MPERPQRDLRKLYAQEIAERGFEADPMQRAVMEHLDQLRSRLITTQTQFPKAHRWLANLSGRATEPVRGVYLWGPVGRGKTWLMDLFFASLPFSQARRRHFHRFMHDVHAMLKTLRNQPRPLDSLAEELAQDTRVLCFDELYVADIADAMILGGVFAALLKRGVTLVATSNVPPADLYKGGLQRQRFLPTIELLEQNMDVVELTARTDYRLRTLAQAGTYLPLAAPNTAARLMRLFAELGGRDTAAAQSAPARPIEIEGRPIAVVRATEQALWCDFLALCSGPRSQEDYIEIARTYQCVFLTNVPVLDSLLEDEARRFIALVDELYDHNVRLIVSAAAPPGELYQGNRLAAQFARTVSRLIEMQSTDYLAREHRA